MKTVSVLINDLCVPCACRCRHCLLSWDGTLFGVPWERAVRFAERFKEGIGRSRPGLKVDLSFGCSMEHPRLMDAIGELKRLGSPQADYLQCDGLRMRNGAECERLACELAKAGIGTLNFTLYGLPEYHDRFAGRSGDHALILRLMRAGARAGLTVTAGVILTSESAPQVNSLIPILREAGCGKIFLTVPHEEGRGKELGPIRMTEKELSLLSREARSLLNTGIYRPEREWLVPGAFPEETERTVLISLRRDNIEEYEAMEPEELLSDIERADEAYYAAYPSFSELAERYGDPQGTSFYRARDLFYHYRRLYAEEFGAVVPDVTDERFSGSRRS